MSAASLDRAAFLREATRVASEAVARRLQAADAPPFIGQLPLLPTERSAAIERFRHFQDPFAALCRLLKHQPPLALSLLAGEIAGQSDAAADDHGVFRYLEKLLGPAKPTLSNDEREELVLAFRQAAVRLGLTVQRERRPDDRQWRVNELVLQGGARRGHAHTLADVFLRTERAIGLPDPSSTAECVRFCCIAAERITNTPRLAMILENDQTGWHGALYARLRLGEEIGASRIGEALAKELQSSDARPVVAGRRRPELVLRGLDLCLQVPEGGPLVIHDGEREIVSQGGDLVLRAPWPTKLLWRVGDAPFRGIGDWLALPDACAAFDTVGGRFLGYVRPGGRLEVPPGGIAFVSRASFQLDDLSSDVVLGGVRVAWADLDRCEATIGFPGAPSATVAPRPDRRILLAPSIAREAGGTLLLGLSAVASLSVPGEVGAGLAADLWLRHPALPTAGLRVPVTLDEQGVAEMPVGRLLPPSGAAGRLQATLTLPGQERALISATAWYWPGLERFDGTRFYGPVPTNLHEDSCRSIYRTSDGIAIACDGDRPDVLLTFGGGSLRFSAPGVYVAVERPGTPLGAASALPLGTTITLGGNLACTLRIDCDNPNAVLEVGSIADGQAFARLPVRRISFGSLVSALESGDGEVRVRYLGPADLPRQICALMRAETPTHFGVNLRADFAEVAFSMDRPLAALRLECSELLSGSTMALELDPNGQRNSGAEEPGTQLAVLAGSDMRSVAPVHRLRLPFARWDDGVWLVEAFCRVEGMPGARSLRTAADERFAFAFLTRGGLRHRCVDEAQILNTEAAFRRAANAIATPIATEVAEAAWPVDNLYKAAGARLLQDSPTTAAVAFANDLAGMESIGGSPGALPRLSPWHVDLAAFSQPAGAYDADRFDVPDLAPFAGLAVLGSSRFLKDAFTDRRFEPCAAGAFGNFAMANRVKSIDLTDFSFAKLENTFPTSNQIGPHDEPLLLSAEFFRRAEHRTALNLAEAQVHQANGTRIGQSLLLVTRGREAARPLTDEARKLAEDGARSAPGVPFIAPLSDEAAVGVVDELPAFLSALALAARLDARKPGHVRRFRDAIQQGLARDGTPQISPEDGIGVCTRIGYPLFAAYLLLWEVVIRSREE